MKINLDEVPKTILEAVDSLVASMSIEDKKYICESKEPYSQIHFLLGGILEIIGLFGRRIHL